MLTSLVIGPNAKVATIFGGGSASLRPYYAITPYDGIAAQAKDIKYAVGAMAYKRLPDFGPLLKVVDSEKAGFSLTFFTEPHSVKDRKAIDTLYMDSAILALNDYKNPLIKDDLFYTKLEGLFYPEMDGVYEFGLTCHGTAELFVSGSSKIDNTRDQVPGDSFFGAGTIEMRNQVELKAGTAYNITVEFGSAPTSTMVVPGATSMGGGGFILGGTRALDAEEELVKAVNLAKEVDQVIICAGLNVSNSPPVDKANALSPSSNLKVTIVHTWTSQATSTNSSPACPPQTHRPSWSCNPAPQSPCPGSHPSRP